ncbi:MAG: LamG domain-containing protein [Planctomycetaceae bacterium]|nr:MAG: LamG domain-containing protein [Planctomycetaceae bacterium]
MSAIIHHKSSIINHERGVALLLVLLIIMAITILSLGFISRCDTELACGQNMLLRTQMDQLADSALEHARGLILNPQDVGTEYWHGAEGQQLMADGPDFYDVNVTPDDSNPNEHRNYSITCEAYQSKNGQKVGSSRLSAQLRLDPCVALWTEADTLFRPRHILYGDFYCAGAVQVLDGGTINGDVFSNALTGTVAGQPKPGAELLPLLAWPPVTRTYASPVYGSYPVSPGTLTNTDPTYQIARVWQCAGDLTLGNNVAIQGMLLVDGNLTIRGNTNLLRAAKNLPALYVRRDLVVEDVDNLRIEGLAVVEGGVRVSAGASNVHILGGLFVKGGILETAPDSAGGHCDCIVYDAPTWRPNDGQQGALEFDGVNDHLRTLDNASLRLDNDYTISVWLKPAASQKAAAAILAKTDAVSSSNHWALQFGAGMELFVYHPNASWPTGIKLADMTAADRWYHVIVVRQGNTMRSYLDDGTPRKEETWDIGPGSGDGHLNVAVDRAADPACLYTGLIDDLRIYNQAVTMPPPNGVPSLIGHWKLDESGSDVTIIAEPARSAIVTSGSPDQYWSQAAGAFYRSIRRN